VLCKKLADYSSFMVVLGKQVPNINPTSIVYDTFNMALYRGEMKNAGAKLYLSFPMVASLGKENSQIIITTTNCGQIVYYHCVTVPHRLQERNKRKKKKKAEKILAMMVGAENKSSVGQFLITWKAPLNLNKCLF
jgi:hypothetical protein